LEQSETSRFAGNLHNLVAKLLSFQEKLVPNNILSFQMALPYQSSWIYQICHYISQYFITTNVNCTAGTCRCTLEYGMNEELEKAGVGSSSENRMGLSTPCLTIRKESLIHA
jgi:hypothetical protein